MRAIKVLLACAALLYSCASLTGCTTFDYDDMGFRGPWFLRSINYSYTEVQSDGSFRSETFVQDPTYLQFDPVEMAKLAIGFYTLQRDPTVAGAVLQSFNVGQAATDAIADSE